MKSAHTSHNALTTRTHYAPPCAAPHQTSNRRNVHYTHQARKSLCLLAGSPCHPPYASPSTRPLRASIAARPVLSAVLPPHQARTRRAPTALRSTRARAVVAPPSASRRAAGAHAERRPGLGPGAISAAAPAQPDRARSWADHGRIGARATAGTIVRAGGGRSCRGSWRCSPRAAAWSHPPG